MCDDIKARNNGHAIFPTSERNFSETVKNFNTLNHFLSLFEKIYKILFSKFFYDKKCLSYKNAKKTENDGDY